MALIVENGTGLAGAESYASVADCALYATNRGFTFPATPVPAAEQALRRATEWIDATYRGRFSGVRVNDRDQALEWPRSYALDIDGYSIDGFSVPKEVFWATCEAAIRELATPGSMSPDLERGGGIKSLEAGSVGIEYFSNAEITTTFIAINNALSRILVTSSSSLVGRLVRG